MHRLLRHLPSPAMVVALVALSVAIGGTGYAASQIHAHAAPAAKKKRAHKKPAPDASQDIKQIRGLASSLTVKAAGFADTAGKAAFATSAGGAPPTGAAGGDLAGSYPSPTLAAPEAFHQVGAPGEPAFQNGWRNNGSSVADASFYKDREGVVHLEGHVIQGSRLVPIFQLPAGYRPASGIALEFPVVCSCSTTDNKGDIVQQDTGEVVIDGPNVSAGSDGAVILESQIGGGPSVSLDGITFRAET